MVAKLILGFAVLASAAQAAGAGMPITVARMGSTIDDAETVGSRRAGMLCLPDGRIAWGDIGAGTSMDQRAIVEDTLEDAGVPVTPLGVGPDRAARLRGTVRAASFSLCARHYLGGGRKALSGDATLEIEWRLETMDGAPVRTHVSAMSRTFDAKHAAPLGAVYRLMLTDAAKDAAAWLKAN